MEYRVLGSVEVRRDGELLDLGAKQRSLLALLLVEANRVVSIDRIIDELWGADAGRDRQNALWVSISKLRSTLEPARVKRNNASILVTRPPGYMLVAAPDEIDAHKFEELTREGRSMLEVDPGAASLLLSEALALWRGRAFEEYTYESFAAAEIARLEELRLAAVGDRVAADLHLGRHHELIGELQSLVRLEPLSERFASSLMLALYRSGRQADALRAFADHRTYVAEELGLDPSPDLVQLEQRILLDDPMLRFTARAEDVGGQPDRSLSVRGYEMREQIGTGLTGVVYAAFQPAVGREVAVTVIRPEVADHPDFIRRFEPQGRRVTRHDHPRIATVYDFWREPGRAFLVMPRFERGNLRDVLHSGPVEPSRAARIVEQVASALSASHVRGIAHGDLRPENVLFDAEDNAYLVDLGGLFDIGETIEAGREPMSFRPPELIAGGEPTVSADVFALGRLAELVFAEAAAAGPLAAVVARACAEFPDERFETVDAFVDALAIALDDHTLDADVDIAVENPYRGLRAFGEGDADRFFGRERLVERLLVRLGATGQKGRFVVLVGPSGSGKSSVVRAGLLPALGSGAIIGSDRWFIVAMTPGRRPFEALAEALESVAVDPPDDLVSRLRTDGIARVAASVIADETAQLVIVVDQLEELFSLASIDEAGQFMSALCSAASDRRSLVKIVATLRADFYDHPLNHPDFGELVRLGTEVITPMNPQELERAITGPVELAHVAYEPGVVSAIVADMAGQTAALPMMQYALTELFERRTGTTIRLDTYNKLGGLSASLAGRADELFGQLGPGEQSTLHAALLRLVTIGDGTADTRRRTLVSQVTAAVGSDVESLLHVFARHRLLTFDRDPVTRGPTVEIAHEALLTAWSRLRRWIDDARDDLRAQRRLAEAADEWHTRGADVDFLLAGARLDTYDGWIDDPPVRLTDRERQYLLDSHAASRADEVADRRRVRRLRRLVAVVGIALVVAVVAGGIALRQRQLATDEATQAEAAAAEAKAQSELAIEQRRRADEAVVEADTQSEQALDAEQRALESRENADIERLSALSAAQVTVAPDVAILLALEANRRRDDVGTQSAMQQAIAARPGLIDVFPNTLHAPSLSVFSRDADVGVAWTVAPGDAAIQFFDSKSGELLGDSQETDEGIQSVAISDDGKVVAIGLLDSSIRFVNRDGQDVAPPFAIGETPRGNMSLDRTGSRLLLSTALGFQVVDVDTGTVVSRYRPFDGVGPLNPLEIVGVLSSDGSFFVGKYAFGEEANSLAAVTGYDIVDASTGELRERVSTGEIIAAGPFSPLPLTDMYLSVTDRLVVGRQDGSIEVRDIGRNEPVMVLYGLTGQIVAVSAGRGDAVAAVQDDGTMRLWSADGSDASPPISIGGGVVDVAFGTDGAASVSLAASGFMRFDPKTSVMVDQIRRRPNVANVFAGHGLYERRSADLSTAWLRSLSTDEVVSEFPLTPESLPYGVGANPFYSSDGQWWVGTPLEDSDPFMVGTVPWGEFQDVDLSGALTRAGLAPLDRYGYESSYRVGPGGERLILVRSDRVTGIGEAVWIDVATSEVLFEPIELDGFAGTPFVLADGRVVVGWDTSDLKILRADFDGPPVVVAEATGFRVFDIDDHTGLILIGSRSGQVGLLDVDTATVRYLEDAGDILTAGAFSHDGQRVVVYSDADGIQVLDTATGRRIGIPMRLDGVEFNNVERITWDEDDNGVWMTTSEGLIRFSASAAAWREIACDIVHRELTAQEWDTLVSNTETQVSACT